MSLPFLNFSFCSLLFPEKYFYNTSFSSDATIWSFSLLRKNLLSSSGSHAKESLHLMIGRKCFISNRSLAISFIMVMVSLSRLWTLLFWHSLNENLKASSRHENSWLSSSPLDSTPSYSRFLACMKEFPISTRVCVFLLASFSLCSCIPSSPWACRYLLFGFFTRCNCCYGANALLLLSSQ